MVPSSGCPENTISWRRVEVQYRQAIGNDDTQPFIDYKDIVEMKIVKEYQ